MQNKLNINAYICWCFIFQMKIQQEKKKQMIPRTNYYRCRLRRWHSTSSKYTKLNLCCIIWSRQQVALASISMQTKMKYMCFNQKGDISTLNDGSLKLVDKLINLGRSISSTENDISERLAKAWTAIDRLSIIWKSNLSDKIKCKFFQAAVVSILLYGCTTWTLT